VEKKRESRWFDPKVFVTPSATGISISLTPSKPTSAGENAGRIRPINEMAVAEIGRHADQRRASDSDCPRRGQ